MKMILAMDKNGCIGRGNALPWHLPKDLAFFKAVTLNKPILMGSNTWLSLPFKPLPKRDNIVLTRASAESFVGAKVCSSVGEAVAYGDDLMIIGGASVYAQFIDFVDTIYVTHVEMLVEGGDTFFDMSKLDDFYVDSTTNEVDNGVNLRFVTYKRRA